MLLIDPRKTWRRALERLDTEHDPELRRNVAMLITHMMAEARCDTAALLSTVSENAHYHFWTPAGVEEKIGKPAVAAFYESVINTGIHRIEHDVTNLVVDRHCITTEGEFSMGYPGALINATHGLDLDNDQLYLYRTQMLIVWPIGTDGLFTGEDTYSGVDGFAGIADRPVAPDQIYDMQTNSPAYPEWAAA